MTINDMNTITCCLPSTVAPSAPTDLSASEVTECSATFTWSMPAEAQQDQVDSFVLSIRKKSDEDNGEYREVSTVDAKQMSTIVEELEENEEYDVIVRSVNKAGISRDSAKTSIKTKKKIGMCSSSI